MGGGSRLGDPAGPAYSYLDAWIRTKTGRRYGGYCITADATIECIVMYVGIYCSMCMGRDPFKKALVVGGVRPV